MAVINMAVDNIIKGGVSPIAPRIKPSQPTSGSSVVQTSDSQGKSNIQMNLEVFLRSQLSDLAKAVDTRSQLMASLPDDVREAVQNLIQQTSMTAETLPQGMAEMLKSQRNLAEQMQTLGETLANAAVLNGETDSDLRAFLAKVSQQFAGSSPLSPEAAAREVLDLVNRLMAGDGEIVINQDEAVKKLAERLLGKEVADLPEGEQRLLQSMVEEFGAKVSQDLKQLAQLLQARSSGIPLTPEQEGALAELIKSLPPEIGQIAQEMLTESGAAQKLSNLAETLEGDAMIKANSPKELLDLLMKTADKFAAWSSLPPNQAAEELLQLAQRMLNQDPATPEIKQMLQQLAEQLPAMHPEQLTDKENAQLNSLLKNLTDTMPAVLQQAAAAENLPELSRLWSLFKAAGAVQWPQVTPQQMEQAAALLGDLAQAVNEDPTAGSQLLSRTVLLDSLPPELLKAVKENLAFSQGGNRIQDLVNALQQLGESAGDGAGTAAGLRSLANQAAVSGKLDAWVNHVLQKALQQIEQGGSGGGAEVKAMTAALQELAETMSTNAGGKNLLSQAMAVQGLPGEIGELVKSMLQQEDSATRMMNFSRFMAGVGAGDAGTLKDFQQILSQLSGQPGASGAVTLNAMSSSLLTALQSYTQDTVTTVDDLKRLTQVLSVRLLGSEAVDLPENEQRLLQQLVRNLGANLPAALQQAAGRTQSPQLMEVYTLLKAIETGNWQNGLPDHLQKAAEIVKEMAQSVYKGTGLVSQKQVDHSVLSFTTPLYFGEGTMPYPAYVHIYQQNNEQNRRYKGKSRFETWMRVSLETENLGVVDTIFRLYDEDQLSVRVRLNGLEAAEIFSDSAIEIRKKLNEGRLKLAEFNINAG